MTHFPCERAAGSARIARSITIDRRIDDELLCAAIEQLPTELLDCRLGETGADCYLDLYTGTACRSHHLPTSGEQRARLGR